MTSSSIAVRGTVDALDSRARSILVARSSASDAVVRDRTSAIIEKVRAEGDAALLAFAREFDGVTLSALEIPRTAWRESLNTLPPALRRALEHALANIRQVHEAFRPVASEVITADGAVIGRRPDPLGRVGVYAPGGRAAYPSSVLMGVVPARVAGVGEIIVCSPPEQHTCQPSDVVLAAAALAGAHRVFSLGGAGAIAALAFGTASVPRVD